MVAKLELSETPIPGLVVVRIPVPEDSRGWFKENWQNEKLENLGFTNFKPVQNNVSFNQKIGTTRGIHAEPWDKYVSVASGKVFGAWVDLRAGESFGKTFTLEIDPGIAVFVPRGVGNAFQTLVPDTSYTYLVNSHWSPNAKYTYLNLADEGANIQWPIPLNQAELSPNDANHPRMKDVKPFQPLSTVILGSQGQVGSALKLEFPEALALSRTEFDLTDETTWSSIIWDEVGLIMNASAYTKVDAAETIDGRKTAWAVNAVGLGKLVEKCELHNITLVHISSDYVFDGTKPTPYSEKDDFAPASVYGQTKAAGDLLVAQLEKHYIVRTSWVIGEGSNFVRTMATLAQSGKSANVVNDQIGRLTFAEDIAKFIKNLQLKSPKYGTYNLSSAGEPLSWYEIARQTFELLGSDPDLVQPISSQEFSGNSGKTIANRPSNSVLDLSKLATTGFQPENQLDSLSTYLNNSISR